MNERIKLLADQAVDWADNQNFYESDYKDYLMQKFAELVIKECGHVADNSREQAAFPSVLMREHFGVK
jgi:hypothetical protein